MKTTRYFDSIRQRPDRAPIKKQWIQYVMDNPARTFVQEDGRIRKWAKIAEMNDRYLRVVLLDDAETVHNAFFDRGFKP